MLYMQANESLARVYMKVIKASGQQIKWKGIFLIRYNTVVLIGDVRSLYLDLDKRTVKTGAEEFYVRDLVPVGDYKLLTNLLNMLLYAFGKWESVKGLKVEQGYDTLTALFKGILQEIDTVPYFSDKGYKFSHNNLQVTFEEVMLLAVEKRKREEEQKVSGDEDENMGLWHSMKWKVQNILFEREDIGEEDVKSRRMGHNFYMTPYKCPDCGMHLHMAVYPEGDEFKIETEEGKVFLARVYSCPECNVFYTPRPEKLLRESDIYALRLDDDDLATKDYRKLLGEKAVRTANGNFNLFETDYYRKGKRHNRTLPQICRDLNKLTQEDIEEILEKMQEGFFSERDRDRFKAIIEQELFYRESVASRQKGEFGVPRDYKDDTDTDNEGVEAGKEMGTETPVFSVGMGKKRQGETDENNEVNKEKTDEPETAGNNENTDIGVKSGLAGRLRKGEKIGAEGVLGIRVSGGDRQRERIGKDSDGASGEDDYEDKIEKLLRDMIEEIRTESDEERIAKLLSDMVAEIGGDVDGDEVADFVHGVMGKGDDISAEDRVAEILRDIMGDAVNSSERDVLSELLKSVIDEMDEDEVGEGRGKTKKVKRAGKVRRGGKISPRDIAADDNEKVIHGKKVISFGRKAAGGKDKIPSGNGAVDDNGRISTEDMAKDGGEMMSSKDRAADDGDMVSSGDISEYDKEMMLSDVKDADGVGKISPRDIAADDNDIIPNNVKKGTVKNNVRQSAGNDKAGLGGEEFSTLHGDIKFKQGRGKTADTQDEPPLSPEEKQRKKQDEQRIAEICPDPADVDFADGLAALKKIQEEDLLPEIKSGMIDQLDKRLTRLKADESEQLVEKLKKEMQGKVSDYSRIYFYNARKMLRGNSTDKASSLIRTAISTYAYNLAEYEYPLMISDSSIFKGGKEGFILTPDNIFYKGLIKSGTIDINGVKSVDVNAAIRGKGIIVHHETDGRLKLPCTLSGSDLSGMAEVLDGFIEYLQEKPESRSVSYLSRKNHAVKCCYRCGHTFKDGNICPNCGSKVLS